MGKRGQVVVIVLILAGASVAGSWAGRARVDRQAAAKRLEQLQVRRRLLGKPFELCTALKAPGEFCSPAAEMPHALALLIVGADGCLRCLLEIDRWRALGASQGAVEVVAVVVGAPRSLTERLAREEKLPFPVLADPDSSVPYGLGLAFDGTLRLIVVDGRIALIADGPDDGPVGFPEAVLALTTARRATSD